MKVAVLLTGAAKPASQTPFAVNQDQNQRLNQYIIAITNFVTSLPNIPVVYIDSSGVDIRDHMQRSIAERPNFYSGKCDMQDIARSRGKGSSELQSIRVAFKNIDILKRSDYILKINGRYLVRNIVKLMNGLHRQLEMIDPTYEAIIGDFRNNLMWFDSRIFCATSDFFCDFVEIYQDDIDDFKGIYFEHCLSRYVHHRLSRQRCKYDELSIYPWIVGTSGSTGKSYSGLCLYRLKALAYQLKKIIISR